MATSRIQVSEGSGKNVATYSFSEDAVTKEAQRVVLADSTGAELSPATASNQSAANTLTGAVNETAPGTDTASSGLNGRLQRIAQRLTSLIALLPTTLSTGGNLKVSVEESTANVNVTATNLDIRDLSSATDSVTVTGTVTANLGTLNGAATAANQATGNSSLSSLDTKVVTYANNAVQATPTGTVALGHDGTNVRALATDASGNLQVDVLTMPTTTVTGSVGISSLPNEGQQTMANSISVAIASDQSNVPISGTVTANAGTNLNTSALALESGGNLAAAATSLAVLDDWDESDRAKVNPIVGQAGVAAGSGTVSATTQRVVLATDVALPAGTNNIGDVDVLTLPSIPAGTNNIGDVDVLTLPALPAGTNTIGNVGGVSLTSGGALPGKLVSAASTNATSIKGSAGQLYMLAASNTNASARYLKVYNKASAPTVGTDTPVHTFLIPGNSGGTNIPMPSCGEEYSLGIGIALTTGATDADTGAVAANEIIVNYAYE